MGWRWLQPQKWTMVKGFGFMGTGLLFSLKSIVGPEWARLAFHLAELFSH